MHLCEQNSIGVCSRCAQPHHWCKKIGSPGKKRNLPFGPLDPCEGLCDARASQTHEEHRVQSLARGSRVRPPPSVTLKCHETRPGLDSSLSPTTRRLGAGEAGKGEACVGPKLDRVGFGLPPRLHTRLGQHAHECGRREYEISLSACKYCPVVIQANVLRGHHNALGMRTGVKQGLAYMSFSSALVKS